MERITAGGLQQLFADSADASTYGCFEYQGVSLGFYTDDAAMLDRYSRFFGGYFEVTARKDPDAVVHYSQDPAVFHALKEWTTSHGRPRSEYETEYAVDEQHRIIYRRAYSRKAHEAEGRVEENCFVLAQPGRKVLLSAPGRQEDPRPLKRTLRHLMKLQLLEQGWVTLHSATCVWNDTGICILGGKFAGKTSTLVNLLSRPGARLVSNDNLFVRDAGTHIEGCGFPNGAGFRIGALVAYPKLAGWVDHTAGSFYADQVDAETFRDIVATTPADELRDRPERVRLLATELAEQLDVPIQHLADIQLFLVVQFDPSLERSRLEPVTDPQEIRESLGGLNFRALARESQDFLQGFFDLDDDVLQARLDAMLEKYGSRMVVQKLYQGANTNEHSAELIGELTQRLHAHA